ncbi:MAG: chemotaxis protein CheA [Spirochaetaceae bacterium]
MSKSEMDNILHDIFIQEAEENIEILESRIIGIEEHPDDIAMINEIFRAIHSIKGGAGLAGFKGIQDFTHIVEDLFENIRSGVLSIEKDLISVVLRSLDILKLMISNIKDGLDSNKDVTTEDVISEIKTYLDSEQTENDIVNNSVEDSDKCTNYYYINLEYYESIFITGIDPTMFLSDLEKMGKILFIETNIDDFPDVSTFDPENFYLKWKIFYETESLERDINDIFCFVIDECDISIVGLTETLNDTESLEEFKINGKILTDFITIDVDNPVIENLQEIIIDNIITETEVTIVESEPEVEVITEVKKDRRKTDRRSDRRSEERTIESYIRVPTVKLENIFNTVSELLISQARLNMLTEEYGESIPDGFLTVQDSLKNITHLIQEQVTSLRMMSLSSTFDRFKRVVRDIATDKGKKIKLEINGQDTELDKNMIEKLNDPIKHLVRNCIDHGIESQDERVSLGKSSEGLLKMSAYLQDGKVVIEISDDGRGINREKLLKKSIENGIIDENHNLTDSEILNLIFHPGLSTAETVTDLSGRGVGMDVVKSSINELHGNVSIESVEGSGTTFKLYLPLTLAILDGMLISVSNEKYIVPTLSILEIMKTDKVNLKTISGGGEVVLFRKDYIPLIRLHKVLNIQNSITDPSEAELIVINSGGSRTAILVDNVIEQYQVVLKSLQRNFKKVDHISSATILGNGDVALILDIPSLLLDSKKGV